jgi:hypothetical protein
MSASSRASVTGVRRIRIGVELSRRANSARSQSVGSSRHDVPVGVSGSAYAAPDCSVEPNMAESEASARMEAVFRTERGYRALQLFADGVETIGV